MITRVHNLSAINCSMSLLDDIRSQPKHIREMMFAFCVIITVSLVGLIWFRSFEEDLFVLINPDPEKQAQFFADRDKNTPTLIASVNNTLAVLRGTISEIFLLGSDNADNEDSISKSDQKTYLLPLPGNK